MGWKQRPAHILMPKPCEDLDFSEGSLTVGLVLKGGDLLDGNLCLVLGVIS
jgi:hypothetical protein